MPKLHAKSPVLPNIVCAILIALFFEAIMWSWRAALIGALIGFLISQVLHLQRTLKGVLTRLNELEADAEGERRAPAEQSAVPPQVSDSPSEAERNRAGDEAPAPTPEAASSTPASGGWGFRDRLAGYAEQALAGLKGGNPLARVGIVILFFGGAFLAKYSVDHGLFPVEMRFAALGLGAIALLGLGWWLRQREPTFAYILQGGGVAGFYLTVFAATRLFDLLPPVPALALMLAVALAAAVLAVAQDTLSLAFLGTVGGFLAPLLVGSSTGSHIALFSYYTVLNLGVFTVAWFRAWRILNLAGFIFTFSISGLFQATAYSASQLISTDFFLLLFFLLYVAISILFSVQRKPRLKSYLSSSLVFGLPVVVFTLHAALLAHINDALVWSALGFSLFYAATSWVLYISRNESLRLLCEAFAALTVIFASLAIPLAVDTYTIAAMWAIEGAGMVWLGVRQQRLLVRGFGLLLQLLGSLGYIFDVRIAVAHTAMLPSAYIATLMISIGALSSGYWLHRARRQLSRLEAGAATAVGLWAVGWWLYGGGAQVERSVPSAADYGALLLFGAASALLLERLSERLVWPVLELSACATLLLTGVFGLSFALVLGHPSAALGYSGWPAILLTAYFLLYRLESGHSAWFERKRAWAHAGTWLLLALLLSWESSWRIERYVDGVWSVLPWGLIPILLVWPAIRPPRVWPFTTQLAAYRRHAASVLAAFALLWVLMVNLVDSGATGGLRYVPMFNPLDISVGLVLLVAARYWHALGQAERARVWPWQPRFVGGIVTGLIFVWLTAALLRSLHYLLGVPWHLESMLNSFLVQASLSIFWGVLSVLVIIIAARRGLRLVWMMGAVLMAVVVVKLFAADLAGTNTIARIVSFLGVGGLLLLAGYLSPLPPRERQPEATS